MSNQQPVLHYFSICGRGEVARLICAAGELEFDDKTWHPSLNEQGTWRDPHGENGYKAIGGKHGFPGVLPILEHGDLKLFQTTAIESYLANISPKFADLTPQQKAKDEMFQLIKSEINGTTEHALFQKITPDELQATVPKWYAYVEGLLPECGFINGLDFPTPGDLCILILAKGFMPFTAAFYAGKITEHAPTADKYPKMFRIANECEAYGPVQAFLAKSQHKTLTADPFGLKA